MKIPRTRIVGEVTGEQAIVYFTISNVRDLSDVRKISDEIEEIAYNYNIKLLVINFAKLRQMTSAFLSRLITLNSALKQMDIRLRLCSMCPEVERAYTICKLQKLIPLYPTEEKALKG